MMSLSKRESMRYISSDSNGRTYATVLSEAVCYIELSNVTNIVKSFSVGKGDMFYINHDEECLTVIDCHFTEDDESDKDRIIQELSRINPHIFRFISTHPDEDHIKGLKEYTGIFEKKNRAINFYFVDNNVPADNPTNSFKTYLDYKKRQQLTYKIRRGLQLQYLNESGNGISSCNIEFLWPDRSQPCFHEALRNANAGIRCNDISPIIKYTAPNGLVYLWFGDMETPMLEEVLKVINIPRADIVFAPHHGRTSGSIPEGILQAINPQVIVLGIAESEYMNYYKGWCDIPQYSAGDITFFNDSKGAFVCFSKGGSYMPSEGKWVFEKSKSVDEFGRCIGYIKKDRIYE